MIISEETRKNVIKNLSKDGFSFHYNLSNIEKSTKNEVKSIKNLSKIFIIISIVLMLIDFLKIFSFSLTFIIAIFIFYYIGKVFTTLLDNFQESFINIEKYLKNKEINKISEDKDLLKYYSLNDIDSEEGKELSIKYFLNDNK